MSAKRAEGSIEADSKRAVGINGVPRIVECSISFRQADWGPRILLSLRTEESVAFSETDWVYPLFVANAEAHEGKLRLKGDTKGFWADFAGELSRVLKEGGVVTTVHNFDSAGQNQPGND
jgi:hypothetical protein